MMNPVRDQNLMHVQCKNHMTTYNINVSGNQIRKPSVSYLPAKARADHGKYMNGTKGILSDITISNLRCFQAMAGGSLTG